MNGIAKRVVDLIGRDAFDKLRLHGLSVIDTQAVDRFLDEHRKSNDRIRAVSAATMRAAGLVTARVEIEDTVHGPRLIVTLPAGDEQALGREIAEYLSTMWAQPPGTKLKPIDGQPDTCDVDIAAKVDEDDADDGPEIQRRPV